MFATILQDCHLTYLCWEEAFPAKNVDSAKQTYSLRLNVVHLSQCKSLYSRASCTNVAGNEADGGKKMASRETRNGKNQELKEIEQRCTWS